MKWREHDHYIKHQLVGEDGKILGTVTGSDLKEYEGWWATVDVVVPPIKLGSYATLAEAQGAVESSARLRLKAKKAKERT